MNSNRALIVLLTHWQPWQKIKNYAKISVSYARSCTHHKQVGHRRLLPFGFARMRSLSGAVIGKGGERVKELR